MCLQIEPLLEMSMTVLKNKTIAESERSLFQSLLCIDYLDVPVRNVVLAHLY